ncbi:MAG: hypothetical protein INR69_03530 [Mucilaginibacter polytrichastri]|nr:hypothetical protein [Mucilaginibacter polytrichastri]
MIKYDSKIWFPYIFSMGRSDTIRKLFPFLLICGFYSFLIVYFELHIFRLSQGNFLNNLTVMHSILGFVISLLLSFRVNSAYDRWWEGRKLLGSLVNMSRNLSSKIKTHIPDPEVHRFYNILIPEFAFSLMKHLRDEKSELEFDIEGAVHLNDIEGHRPNHVALAMFQRLQHLYRDGVISGEQLIVIDNEMSEFADICGACERIKNTPIPYSYSSFIKKFIFTYVITLPFDWAFSLGYVTIPLVMFVMYVMASMELIAEEVENPFGTDPNDLPFEAICQGIKKHVGEILS